MSMLLCRHEPLQHSDIACCDVVNLAGVSCVLVGAQAFLGIAISLRRGCGDSDCPYDKSRMGP